jgi:hypothetical protein
MPTRRSLLVTSPWLLAVLVGLASCGGPGTRLVTVRAGGGGGGKLELTVKNLTDVPINTFYLARTEAVDKAGGPRLDPDSPEGADVWGPDLLGQALVAGKGEPVAVPAPGRWDARAVDRAGREQLVTGLTLAPGGKYVLELHESGWRNYTY